MSSTIQDIDHGFKAMLAGVRSINRQEVAVGLLAEDNLKYPDGQDLVEAAMINEFGEPASRIPSRPFMRTTFDRNQAEIGQRLSMIVAAVVDRKSPGLFALTSYGTWYTKLMTSTLLTGPWAPNAPKTVMKKGSSQPLVDSTLLSRSFRAVIRKTP